MACSNSRYQKSGITLINANAQTVTAAATTLAPGTSVFTSGCSLALGGNGIAIQSSGLYRAEGHVTITPSAAGTITLALYLNGVLLPSSVRQNTVAADTVYTIDTDAAIFEGGACCMLKPQITLVVSGVAGTVSWLSMSAVKQA